MKVSANGRSHLVSYSVPIGKVHILGMQFSSSRSSDSIPWVWTGGVLRRLWVSVRGEHPKNGAGCPVVWCEKNMREGMIHVLSSKTVGPPEFPVYQFLVCFWFSIHRIWKNIITFSRMEHWHNKHIFETTHLKRNPNMKKTMHESNQLKPLIWEWDVRKQLQYDSWHCCPKPENLQSHHGRPFPVNGWRWWNSILSATHGKIKFQHPLVI